jgi:PAS domain S-box-containing protein
MENNKTSAVNPVQTAPLPVPHDLSSLKAENEALQLARDLAVKQLEDFMALMQFSSGLAKNAMELRSRTEQIKNAKAMLREKNQIQKYLDVAGVILLVLDKTGRITLINRKGCEILEKPREEILGRNWLESFVPRKARPAVEETFARLLQECSSKVESSESPLLRASGGERSILWNNVVLRDDKGEVCGLILSGEDITERKHLEAQFIQAQKMEAVGRLAGGIAHDFNNLISVILGYSSFLLENITNDESIRADVNEIQKAGERAASLTRQLLAFSRKQPLQPRVLRLDRLVTDMEKFLRRIIGEDIVLVTRALENLGDIKADPGQVEQVIMNLAVNARDAMPGGGTLTIKTGSATLDASCRDISPEARAGKFITLTITDTGAGMTREVLSHVFEPFYTTKELGKGTGLGLSTVYGIIRQHDGFITVNSEYGKGTTFTIYLPAFSFEEAVQASVEPEEQDLLRSGGEHILLVEDEEGVRRFAARTLRKYGYVVTEAAGFKDAVAAFRKIPGAVNMLFTDVVLPDNTGVALTEELMSLQPGLKVVISSGYVDEKSQWPAIQKKGFPFLPKPYTSAELLRTVRASLGKPHAQAAPPNRLGTF